jgi:hypothetical protein
MTSPIETLETSYRSPLKGMISAISLDPWWAAGKKEFFQGPAGVFKKKFSNLSMGAKKKANEPLCPDFFGGTCTTRKIRFCGVAGIPPKIPMINCK